MQITIIVGIIIFCILAVIIANGYKQLSVRSQYRVKVEVRRKLAQTRERQFLLNSLPTAYFPKEAQLMLANDIITQLDAVLDLTPNNHQARDLHREVSKQLDKMKKGQAGSYDHRKAQTLTEAENVHRLTQFVSDYLKNRYLRGEISQQELTELHEELEVSNATASIDGELTLGNKAVKGGKLQSAYYHFNRVKKAIKMLQARTDTNCLAGEMKSAQAMLDDLRAKIEATGEKIHDPAQASRRGSKAWDSLMEEEAKYSRDNPDLE